MTNDTRAVEWVSAIGTVGAVVVALLLAALPAWNRRRSRPRLEIRVGNEEPHIRPTRGGVAGRPGQSELAVQGYILRVEVKNVGRSEARRVRVQLLGWASERKGEKELDWIAYDIDPMPLKWVEAPGDEFLMDLAAGMSGLAYVGEYHDRSGELELFTPDSHRREFPTKPNYSNVTYWVEVAAAAENADVVTTGFYFSTVRDPGKVGSIHSVRTGDPPARIEL